MAVGDKYRAVHARSLKRSRGLLGRAGRGDRLDASAGTRCSTPRKPPFYRWFAGGELNACHNALDRHVERRPRRADGADLRFAGHRHARRASPIASCATSVAKLAGAIAAQGVGKGDRVIIYMPMIPEAVMAMLACARLGAVHSVVFGGFAANELATRIDDCTPKLVLTASCGIEPGRIVHYKPLLDQAIELATHKVPRVHRAPAPAGARRRWSTGRDLDWNEAVAAAAAARLRAGEGDRSALHSLHVGHDRPAQGRGARQRRLLRGARLVDEEPLRRRAGRGLVVRLGRGLGGRPQLHRLRPADPRRDHDPLRGQAGRHARRRRLLARDLRAQGGGAVHRADRLPRHQEGGSRRQAAEAVRPRRSSARCSSPASAAIRRPSNGRRSCSACRSSITGGRPRPAGRSAATSSGSIRCRSSRARARCRRRAGTSTCWTSRASR